MSALLSAQTSGLRYVETIASRCTATVRTVSTSSGQRKTFPNPTAPSRSRLVKDLKTSGSGGVPDAFSKSKGKKPEFVRDEVPHTGRAPRESFSAGSRGKPRPSDARRSERRPARRDKEAPRVREDWDGRKAGSGAMRLPREVLEGRREARDSRAPQGEREKRPERSRDSERPPRERRDDPLSLSASGQVNLAEEFLKPPPIPDNLPMGKRYRSERPHLAQNPDPLDHSLETRRSKTLDQMSDEEYDRFDVNLPKPSPKGSSNMYDKPATGKDLYAKERAKKPLTPREERVLADLNKGRATYTKKEDFATERKPTPKPKGPYNPLGDEFAVTPPDQVKGSDFKGPSSHGKRSGGGQSEYSPKHSSPYDALAPKEVTMDRFRSPPLMPGLLQGVREVLGVNARPSDIQTLSMKWLFGEGKPAGDGTLPGPDSADEPPPWQQFLLAAETGSGKSIAYFLPLLQSLKVSEASPKAQASMPKNRAFNPRSIILAPTHELSRQLANFGKALTHEHRLRIVCASKANVPSTRKTEGTASKMASSKDMWDIGGPLAHKTRGIDILVGTPMKLLEMVRGRGWDAEERQAAERTQRKIEEDWDVDEKGRKIKKAPVRWIRKGEPEIGLAGIEWVVVDEADVLFDPDFQESTRMLLADISAARGKQVEFEAKSVLDAPNEETNDLPAPTSLEYPFHLLLTSATIPSSLATYLDTHHPNLTRLASKNLHHLPKTLQTEYVGWTGGNKNVDVERRLRRVWAEDAQGTGYGQGGRGEGGRSKVLIFCNKSNKVDELGTYLEEKGIKNVALTSTSNMRRRGSNHHLDGFVRQKESAKPAIGEAPPSLASVEDERIPDFYLDQSDPSKASESSPATIIVDVKLPDYKPQVAPTVAEEPYVMITTSLLSRGLDFRPDVRHVFIVDEPRNMIDFLHRAGRSGRAGEAGKVVVFGKMKGRGSERVKVMRKKVGALLI